MSLTKRERRENEVPIDGGMRDKLEMGTVLVATYKKQRHTAEVAADEEGKTIFRLADGREFKSPSAAGSTGWREPER